MYIIVCIFVAYVLWEKNSILSRFGSIHINRNKNLQRISLDHNYVPSKKNCPQNNYNFVNNPGKRNPVKKIIYFWELLLIVPFSKKSKELYILNRFKFIVINHGQF